ncbi:hypothetical protein N8843_08820 [Verrucomicrobia bacterium]|nr:hypothetical protein [Verrucomicrobiota bacterium]MDA7628727.1 hypothetical protein [Verrucomicrobiota bacterium]
MMTLRCLRMQVFLKAVWASFHTSYLTNYYPHKESFIYAQEKIGFRIPKKFHDHYSKTESAECMTQTTKEDTIGLMTVRDVCHEYKITRSQAVNIMGKIPVKLQKHRANWFSIKDVQALMEEHGWA